MNFALRTAFFRTVPGIMKLVELILVIIILFMSRFGGHDIDSLTANPINWGSVSATYLGIGCSVGFAIIVPAIIVTYLLGSETSKLEFIINLVGGILFIAIGASCFKYGVSGYKTDKIWDGVQNNDTIAAVGGLGIVLGILFLIDFIYLCVKNRDIIM